MIEIFGNSHAGLITGAPPSGNKVPKSRNITCVNPTLPIRTWYLGPILAYQFYDKHLSAVMENMRNHPEYFDKSKCTLMFAVGEIDCRVHLPKKVTKGNTVKDVVEDCLKRYHAGLLEVKKLGYDVAVMGAIPCLSDESLKKHPADIVAQNVFGDTSIRNQICYEWELTHSDMCKKDGIHHISIYENLLDSNGNANDHFYVDFIHLSHDKTIDMWTSKLQEKGLLAHP